MEVSIVRTPGVRWGFRFTYQQSPLCNIDVRVTRPWNYRLSEWQTLARSGGAVCQGRDTEIEITGDGWLLLLYRPEGCLHDVQVRIHGDVLRPALEEALRSAVAENLSFYPE